MLSDTIAQIARKASGFKPIQTLSYPNANPAHNTRTVTSVSCLLQVVLLLRLRRDDQLGALLSEGDRDGGPDARRRPRDQRQVAVQQARLMQAAARRLSV